MASCINLKERFGKRFRIRTEDGQRTTAPWLYLIPCRNGEIGPFGGELLQACTNRRGNLPRLLTDAGCTITQDGDDGVNATFHVRDFAKVARVMRPRRRRQMTEEQKRVARERLAGYAFQPARESERIFLGTHGTPPDDQPHQQATATLF